MKEVKFYTLKGYLTDYALSCGYVEKLKDNNITLELYKEHCVYHVRKHNNITGERIFWKSFESLTEARDFFIKEGAE